MRANCAYRVLCLFYLLRLLAAILRGLLDHVQVCQPLDGVDNVVMALVAFLQAADRVSAHRLPLAATGAGDRVGEGPVQNLTREAWSSVEHRSWPSRC